MNRIEIGIVIATFQQPYVNIEMIKSLDSIYRIHMNQERTENKGRGRLLYPGSFHVDTILGKIVIQQRYDQLIYVLANKRINQQVHFKKRKTLLNHFMSYWREQKLRPINQ